MDQIEIALAANQGYVSGLCVTACSIAEQCDTSYRLRFNVLDSEISDESKRFVEGKVLDLHANSVFRWIPVNEQMFVGLPKWNGGYMVYTRLLLPQLLRDIDWCIYCDCDFTWMRDVSELWEMRDDKFAMLGTRDGADWTLDIEEKWFSEHGFAFNRNDYFCAGLTFFNLKKFREEGIDKKCLELLQLHPPYNDQSVLNITCLGQVKLVSQVWQQFTERLTREDVQAGVVIHHAGDVPWKKRKGGRGIEFISDAKLLWHRANARFLGISTWRSLRKTFSPSEIFRKRLAVHLFRLPGVLLLARAVLWALKHPGVYTCIEMRVRRVC